MALDHEVPHPGTRPEPLEFPFPAAEAAVAAIKAKIEHLRSFQIQHDDALSQARVDFEGPIHQQFERELGDGFRDIDGLISKLNGDMSRLEGLITYTRGAVQARQYEIAAWQRKKDDYDQAEATARHDRTVPRK